MEPQPRRGRAAEEPKPTLSSSGWQGSLELRYAPQGARTLLVHKHVGPLRVQRPFFPEGNVNHTYLLHPPGGLVGNDRLTIVAEVAADGHALITTPGATKAYRNICEASEVGQHFEVGGVLEWLPQEVILFDGSSLNSATTFDLSSDATLIGWEVQCLGRPIGELPYVSGQARFDTRVSVDGRPVLQDRLQLTAGTTAMDAPWGLDGATALGVMLAYPADAALRDRVRKTLAARATVTATLLDELLVLRAMGHQAQDIRRVFVEVWKILRPALLQREACLPRIWAT
jgi:urease accessory protein